MQAVKGLFLALMLAICIANPLCVFAKKKKVEIDPDKVLVVMMFDDHCMKWCPKVKAILMQVSDKYGDKVAIHEIDMSQKHLDEAKVKAKKLGIPGFLPAVMDLIPCVGVFSKKRKLCAEFAGLKTLNQYCGAIEKAMKRK